MHQEISAICHISFDRNTGHVDDRITFDLEYTAQAVRVDLDRVRRRNRCHIDEIILQRQVFDIFRQHRLRRGRVDQVARYRHIESRGRCACAVELDTDTGNRRELIIVDLPVSAAIRLRGRHRQDRRHQLITVVDRVARDHHAGKLSTESNRRSSWREKLAICDRELAQAGRIDGTQSISATVSISAHAIEYARIDREKGRIRKGSIRGQDRAPATVGRRRRRQIEQAIFKLSIRAISNPHARRLVRRRARLEAPEKSTGAKAVQHALPIISGIAIDIELRAILKGDIRETDHRFVSGGRRHRRNDRRLRDFGRLIRRIAVDRDAVKRDRQIRTRERQQINAAELRRDQRAIAVNACIKAQRQPFGPERTIRAFNITADIEQPLHRIGIIGRAIADRPGHIEIFIRFDIEQPSLQPVAARDRMHQIFIDGLSGGGDQIAGTALALACVVTGGVRDVALFERRVRRHIGHAVINDREAGCIHQRHHIIQRAHRRIAAIEHLHCAQPRPSEIGLHAPRAVEAIRIDLLRDGQL